MWAALVKWATDNAGISVIIGLIVIFLLLIVFTITWSVFVRPKIKQVDDLLIKVGTIDGTVTQILSLKISEVFIRLEASLSTAHANIKQVLDSKYSESIGSLSGRVTALESARDAERQLALEQSKAFQEAVSRSIEEMSQLQKRGEAEIQRMQNANQHAWAREQIEQDVRLAEITERLARLLSSDQHAEAVESLRVARIRRDALNGNRP